MKKLITVLGLLLVFGMTNSTAKTLINLEEAAEVSKLQLRLNNSGAALIYARICDTCPMLTLRASESTQITRGNRAIRLADAVALKNKGATVLFDPSTLQVTRILFWN
ncbi:MAG: hypothetical protein KJO35_07065 [Gammaproteobacteria bacterium]|nr:hypothetical protein [Gammaproteobacteria bacterium]